MLLRDRTRGGLLVGLAAAALVAGCSVGDPVADATATAGPVAPSTSASPTASAPTSASPTTSEPSASVPPPNPGPGPMGVAVTLPPAGVEATGPAVVLVHGGFWVGGDPDLMDRWADALAASGAVVFNASYRLVYSGGGYPESVDDVACAVRYARAEAATLTTSDELVIMGHSAGGHLAAVVALNGDEFGGDCAYPPAPLPDRLVGLSGLYDIRTIASVFEAFVGAPITAEPEQWASVNPAELVDRRDDLEVVLVAGANDLLVPPAVAEAFGAQFPADRVAVEVVPGAGHNELLDPDVVSLAAVGFEE